MTLSLIRGASALTSLACLACGAWIAASLFLFVAVYIPEDRSQ
jgi:hypothetical protein